MLAATLARAASRSSSTPIQNCIPRGKTSLPRLAGEFGDLLSCLDEAAHAHPDPRPAVGVARGAAQGRVAASADLERDAAGAVRLRPHADAFEGEVPAVERRLFLRPQAA